MKLGVSEVKLASGMVKATGGDGNLTDLLLATEVVVGFDAGGGFALRFAGAVGKDVVQATFRGCFSFRPVVT